MIDSSLLGRRASEYFRLPGVEVAVEVNHTDGPVGLVYGSEKREGDGVVTSESDEARERFAELRYTRFTGSGVGFAHQERVVPVFDLLESIRVVVPKVY